MGDDMGLFPFWFSKPISLISEPLFPESLSTALLGMCKVMVCGVFLFDNGDDCIDLPATVNFDELERLYKFRWLAESRTPDEAGVTFLIIWDISAILIPMKGSQSCVC